jgi:predicted transcriptional regulator
MHKLTPDAVREIRRDYLPGYVTYADLAERFGVSLQLVARVHQGAAWSWVEED